MTRVTTEREHVWAHVREALSASNNDDYSSTKKHLVVTAFVRGQEADLHFEAKIPRASTNELGLTISWFPETREENVSFLRDLADLIAAGPEGSEGQNKS